MTRHSPSILPVVGRFAVYTGLLSSGICHGELPVTSSLQGFTGAFNTPSAFSLARGTASLQYADAFMTASETRHNKNIFASFGLTSWFETGGRVSWDNTQANCYVESCGGVRDLSANLKMRLPVADDRFSVAIGQQDMGGAANFFGAKYVVAGAKLDWARLDAGYGKADVPGRYLDGAFGALEIQPLSGLGLIGEYDAKAVNAGFRVDAPENWRPYGIRTSAKVLAWSNRKEQPESKFFGLSFSIPLGSDPRHYSAPTSGANPADRVTATPLTTYPVIMAAQEPSPAPTVTRSTQAFYDSLADQLQQDKFEHIMVGELNGELVVAFENNQFNRNELDAIGWVIKRACDAAGMTYERIRVILLNEKLPIIEVAVTPSNYLAFVHDLAGRAPLAMDIVYAENGRLNDIPWYARASYGADLKPRAMISPSLTTAVATEYGVFDYSLSLQTDVAVSLWSGALVSATYNQPVDQSSDFDPGNVYNADRQTSVMDEYELQQTLTLAPGVMTTLHGGHFMRNYDGFYDQSIWLSPQGTHKLSMRWGSFHNVTDGSDNKTVSLLGYRYFFDEDDVSLEVTQGTFWAGDKGYRVDTRFWFGDSSITLIYKDTNAQFVGIGLTLPLTPRRDMLTPWGQIKGRENWNNTLQTRVNESANYVAFGNATIPRARNELERSYLANDRLSPAYIRAHWARLRDVTRLMTTSE